MKNKPKTDKKKLTKVQQKKQDKFIQTMKAGRAAKDERRKTFLTSLVEESMTRYTKKEFYSGIWALSPYAWVNGITYRQGHLCRAMGSLRRAIVLCFIIDKIIFAHTNNKSCYDEPLFFEGRQWCYLSVKKLLQTGLFTGIKDVQDTINALHEVGLLYKRPPRRETNLSHATSWYTVEFFHPVLLFWPTELFNSPLEDLQTKASNLLTSPNTRDVRIEEIKAAFKIMKLIPEDEFQEVKGEKVYRTDSKGERKNAPLRTVKGFTVQTVKGDIP